MKYCDYSNSFMIMFFMILPFSMIIAKCISFYLCYNGFFILLIIQSVFSFCLFLIIDSKTQNYFAIFYRLNIQKRKGSTICFLLILEILAWIACFFIIMYQHHYS